MKQVTAYKCDYCARCFLRPCNAVQHEEACNANPARKNCKTCIHGCYGLVKVNAINPALRDDTNNKGEMVPYCDKHNIPIFEKPYEIECEYAMRYGDEVPEPGTCDHYEYKGRRGWTQKDQVVDAQ